MTTLTNVKERPILFSGKMVRAILEGRKTMTRRPVKPQPTGKTDAGWIDYLAKKPYRVGDRLWVRHDFWDLNPPSTNPDNYQIWDEYTRTVRWKTWRGDHSDRLHCKDVKPHLEGWRHRPSIHMPRWASRILLEIVSVRVERIQDITQREAIAEGYPVTMRPFNDLDGPPKHRFTQSWNAAYPGSWDANSWVWCIEFKRI